MAAQLATLVDSIVTALNSAPGGTWSDYTVGPNPSDFVTAKPAIDPENLFESDRVGLYVLPVTMLYNRAASAGRGKIALLNRSPVIALCLSYRFVEHDPTGLDISTWDLTKKILTLREEIDLYVLRRDWGWNIGEITPEPAQEIPLKARWFLSVTEIEFEGMTC